MDSDSDFDANELLDFSSDEYVVKTEDEKSSDDEQDSFLALPSGSTDPGSRSCPGVNLADVTDVGGPDGIPEFRPEYPSGIRLDTVRTRLGRNNLMTNFELHV
ncbi:hypothetical protein PoB_006581900 [Plakobranchus ocellatus]|uniref:Uncharacterized protein n=1 Tax=Plakobranchus ocellatus TaxID=259542 RepID=A0AAV4D598_9GAST|nr:hypothetical protein PoB_006581900 [Plakobranchus ocellatus]